MLKKNVKSCPVTQIQLFCFYLAREKIHHTIAVLVCQGNPNSTSINCLNQTNQKHHLDTNDRKLIMLLTRPFTQKKNRSRLIHGSITEVKVKFRTNFLCNHSVPERKVFQENSYPEIKKTNFGLQNGRSTYTRDRLIHR